MLSILLTTMDCADALSLSQFWADALGYEHRVKTERWVIIVDPERKGVGLGFQRVPEPKTVKNRVHLDLRCDDADREAARLVALGARLADAQHAVGLLVLHDPEGNELCLLRP